jgi:hypothetical protein
VLGGLLVGGALVAAALTYVPPSYSATGSLLLLPPSADVKDGTNPLLALGGLDQPASLSIAYLSGNDVQTAFGEEFAGASFAVGPDPLSRGPIVVFTTKAPTPEEAVAALRGAVALLPQALTKLQDNVNAPSASRVRSTPLTIDTHATVVRGSTMRAVILAGGLGLTLAFVGAVALDSLLARRALRRAGRRAQASVDDKDAPVARATTATLDAQPDGARADPWARTAASQRRG